MDPSTAITIAKHDLLAFGIILAIGTVFSVFSYKLKVPDVAIFLVAGIFWVRRCRDCSISRQTLRSTKSS